MDTDQFFKTESLINEKIFGVSEFLDFLNNILRPCRAIIQGEIGEKINDYKNRGFTFFDLLDKNGAILRCFTWRENIENLGVNLEPGMEIRVVGYPEIRKERGELKFQVEKIELVGEGDLKRAFEALKRKLESEGLFAKENKKTLPRFSQKIGLITSKYGKGAKPDFEKHLGKFGFEIYFYDVRVEGLFAAEEIAGAIRWFNENMPTLDVLVLIRGGGSWESLQAFNSEIVARAIFASKIPVICGVGHESDVTIADLVADFRASTPTDAAKILNENWKTASSEIFKYEENLILAVKRLFKNTKEKLAFFEKNLTSEIKRKIQFLKENFEDCFRDLTKNQAQWIERIKKLINNEEQKLNLGSPILKLKQGYSITYNENGKIIKNASDLKIGSEIKTKFYKSETLSKVKKINSKS
ncbi:MAG TPA: exodeoxyribonuclease VII large subunit [Candidatus Pacearchaeota archaeon]|nr:exodeoxyribonuclease VII large subunit [Candidatus Pacearchaeota archaeon]HOK94410.1 exodeoxyribonuclease VII large subunit [Candidatus Pacearchaeota archaeon]HPO75483.1 exodeoxyribonuclease VII large subunit [Candidatus Pacearchaeota archaeon]